MTSVNELNAYNRGMKEGMLATKKASERKLYKVLLVEKDRYLRLNQRGNALLIQRIIDGMLQLK